MLPYSVSSFPPVTMYIEEFVMAPTMVIKEKRKKEKPVIAMVIKPKHKLGPWKSYRQDDSELS